MSYHFLSYFHVLSNAPQTATSVLAAEADAVEAQAAETAEDTAAVTEDTAAVETGDTEAVTEEGGSAEGSDEAAAGDTETVTGDETADAEDQDAAETVTDDEAVVEGAEASADEEAVPEDSETVTDDEAVIDDAEEVEDEATVSEDNVAVENNDVTVVDESGNTKSYTLSFATVELNSDGVSNWQDSIFSIEGKGTDVTIVENEDTHAYAYKISGGSTFKTNSGRILKFKLEDDVKNVKVTVNAMGVGTSDRYIAIAREDSTTTTKNGAFDKTDNYLYGATKTDSSNASDYIFEISDFDYTKTYGVAMSNGHYIFSIKVEYSTASSGTPGETQSDWAITAIPDVTYNGADQIPTVEVKEGDTVVDASKYDVKYTKKDATEAVTPKDAGEYTVTVTGKGDADGKTATTTYKINAFDLSKDKTATATPADDLTEDGKLPVTVKATLKEGAEQTTLADTDYSVEYTDKDGKAIESLKDYQSVVTIKVTGKGNFAGSLEATKDLTSGTSGDDKGDDGDGEGSTDIESTLITIKDIEDQVYTGKALKPAVVVESNGVVLKLNKDYTVDYDNNTDANTDLNGKPFTSLAKVIVKGKGNYNKETSIEKTFKIKQVNISNDDSGNGTGFAPVLKAKVNLAPIIKSGKSVKVLSSLKYKKALKPGTEFMVTLENTGSGEGITKDTGVGSDTKGWPQVNTEGTYKLVVKALNKNYAGTVTMNVVAGNSSTSMSKAKISLGKDIKSMAFDNIQVTGDKDSGYKCTFKPAEGQTAADLSSAESARDKFTVKMGKDTVDPGAYTYSIVFSNGTQSTPAVGKAQLTVTALDNEKNTGKYVGSKTVAINVTGRKASTLTIDGAADDEYYTGNEIKKDKLTVKDGEKVLTASKEEVKGDYDVAYKNNIKKGKATITITPTAESGFTGSKKVTFKILAATITSEEDVTVTGINKDNQFADAGGKEMTFPLRKAGVQPDVEMGEGFKLVNKRSGAVLVKGVDYTVSYKKNKAEGDATATIKGKGNYAGKIENVAFKIEYPSLKYMYANGMLNISVTPVAYKDSWKTKSGAPKIKVKVLDGNKVLKGSGSKAEYSCKFCNGDGSELSYAGIASYVEDPKVTAPYVIIEGAGNYADTDTGSFNAKDKEIKVSLSFYKSENKLTLKKGSKGNTTVELNDGYPIYYDDGRQVTLDEEAVKVYKDGVVGPLKPGTDYAITGWGANNKVGKNKGSVKIEGRGRYGGSFTYKFDITAKPIDKSISNQKVQDKIDKLIDTYIETFADNLDEVKEVKAYSYSGKKLTVTFAKDSLANNIRSTAQTLFDRYKNDSRIPARIKSAQEVAKNKGLDTDMKDVGRIEVIVSYDDLITKSKNIADPTKFFNASSDEIIATAEDMFNEIMNSKTAAEFKDKTLENLDGKTFTVKAICYKNGEEAPYMLFNGYSINFKSE